MKQLTEDGLIPVSRISPSRSHSPISEMGKSRSPARGRVSHQPSVDDLENSACKLNPSVEGRILQITPEVNSENIDFPTTFKLYAMIKLGEAELIN